MPPHTPHVFFDRALRSFRAGVAAADPCAAVTRYMPVFATAPTLIAVGKAAARMAVAAHASLPKVAEAIVVTNPENAVDVPWARCFAAAHPVPDAVGLSAGQAVMDAVTRAAAASPPRPILCLISGGGSALLPAPVAGVSLADKARVSDLLLASGADIGTVNMIRQQISQLKGGGLLGFAGAAPVTALVLSDVIGDDLRAIASGPTVAPIGTPRQAVDTLKSLGCWGAVPCAVQQYLSSAPPRPAPPPAHNILVGSNGISVAAMASALPHATLHHTPIEGDVAAAAAHVARLGRGSHVFGGETTVVVTGTGKGGRNQELALRVALLAESAGWTAPWLYLQAGSDGRDGPTDAAGGIVTDQTLGRIRAAGVDPIAALANNDAYTALKAGNGLLITGGTGTNVADLGVLIRS